jgi:hypothetical protein
MGPCKHFSKFIQVQSKVIAARIEELRLDLCRKEGREVSRREAQTAYMESLLDGNAKEYREKWCAECEDRSCEGDGDEQDEGS